MPAVFIGHGSPMNTLEHNRYTAAWRAFGDSIPRPRAILCVSAHWYVGYTAVTAMEQPRTIHDFYGFPDELFAFDYPAPGAPGLAAELAEVVAPIWVGADIDGWGLDHGTWSVLAHMFPEADVPVVQLSINATKPAEHHVELGHRLAPLRDRGVLVVCSGNVVHNLSRLNWSDPDGGSDWARRFDDAVRARMVDEPEGLSDIANHPDHDLAVPTPEHFVPLLYLAGLAGASRLPCVTLVDGFAYGSLSMTAYTLGADCPLDETNDRGMATLPGPGVVPAEQTNV